MYDETKYTYTDEGKRITNPISHRVTEYLLMSTVMGVIFYVLATIFLFVAAIIYLLITGTGLQEIINLPLIVGAAAFGLAFIFQGLNDIMDG
jgi:hypothetical protein